MHVRVLFGLALALAAAGGTPAGAQEAASDRWHVTVLPYFTFPHMNGRIAVGPIASDVDVSPAEIFENLQFGAMLGAELGRGPWAFGLNALYMDLRADGERLPTELRTTQGAVELAAFRRLAPWIEVLAGGRVNLLSASASGDVLGEPRRLEADENWFDPFVGARLTAPDTGRWHLWARGDVGGFGVGSSFAWQARVGAGYRVSRLLEVGLAYWAVGMDYESDSNLLPFRYDVTTFGPQVGVALHF